MKNIMILKRVNQAFKFIWNNPLVQNYRLLNSNVKLYNLGANALIVELGVYTRNINGSSGDSLSNNCKKSFFTNPI